MTEHEVDEEQENAVLLSPPLSTAKNSLLLVVVELLRTLTRTLYTLEKLPVPNLGPIRMQDHGTLGSVSRLLLSPPLLFEIDGGNKGQLRDDPLLSSMLLS